MHLRNYFVILTLNSIFTLLKCEDKERRDETAQPLKSSHLRADEGKKILILQMTR